jgi:hypothetical protein
MLSKCANPDCTASFHYLRDGKLFQIDVSNGNATEAQPRLVSDRKPQHRIEYFWLCARCSATMTLAVHPDKGVVAIPLPAAVPLRRAAAL